MFKDNSGPLSEFREVRIILLHHLCFVLRDDTKGKTPEPQLMKTIGRVLSDMAKKGMDGHSS